MRIYIKILIFTTCLFFQSLLANDNQIKISEVVKKDKPLDIELKLNKKDLIRGLFRVNKPIKKLVFVDKDKKEIRQINRFDSLSGRFLFSVEKKGTYYIRAIAAEHKVRLGLMIQSVLPYEKQKHSQKQIKSKRIKELANALGNDKKVNLIFERIKEEGTPLIEKYDENNSLVTFIYKGAQNEVKLFGGPKGSRQSLERLSNSDIWYKSFVIKNDSRFSYQIAADMPQIPGNEFQRRIALLDTAQKDPLNKYPLSLSKDADKYNTLSTLTLKDAKHSAYSKEASKKGSLETHAISSDYLKNRRLITIYKPYGFKEEQNYNVLFIFDGNDHLNKIPTPTILDNLIEQNKISKTIAVFINNPDIKTRSVELPPNEKFANFMAKELVPFIEDELNIKTNAKTNTLAGFSYGGLASAYITFKYPETFGNVLSQSGSFWWKPKKEKEFEWLSRQFAKENKKDIKFYLNAGTFETRGLFNSPNLLNTNRHFRTILEAKNYDVFYEKYSGGHDFYSWSVYLENGLTKLLK